MPTEWQCHTVDCQEMPKSRCRYSSPVAPGQTGRVWQTGLRVEEEHRVQVCSRTSPVIFWIILSITFMASACVAFDSLALDSKRRMQSRSACTHRRV